MNLQSFWGAAWKDEDVSLFIGQSRRRYGAATLVVNKPLRFSFLLTATQGIDTSGNGPQLIDIIKAVNNQDPSTGPSAAGAIDDTTTHWPGSPTTRTQNPQLGDAGIVAQNQSLLLGGVRGTVHMGLLECRGLDADPSTPAGAWVATGAMQDTLNGVMSAFEASELFVFDQTILKAEAYGGDMFSFGPSRVGLWGPVATQTVDGAETVADEIVYGGAYAAKDAIGRRFPAPVWLDGGGGTPARPQSQLKIALSIPRKTAWPIGTGQSIRVDLVFDALWAYNPSGLVIDCDPGNGGAGEGPGYVKADDTQAGYGPRW